MSEEILREKERGGGEIKISDLSKNWQLIACRHFKDALKGKWWVGVMRSARILH